MYPRRILHETSLIPSRPFFRQAVLAAFLGVACVVPAMAAPVAFPAIVQPASQERHIGKMIFVELITPDLVSAKKFYGELFGWTYRNVKMDGTEYTEAYLDGRPVAGLIHKDLPAGERKQPVWRSFFSVDNTDSAVKLAVSNGAKVLFEPHDVPGRGRQAIIADPQGAIFALLNSSSGDPQDNLAEPGEWIWSSLHTSNPDTDAAFYQTLFNYEVFDLSDKKGPEHLLLASGNYARGSVNPLAVNRPDARPHWINYVRVDDAAEMAEKVESLGGKVLVEPHPDRHGGQVAIVADPQGAPFGLFEWSDTESKEVSQ